MISPTDLDIKTTEHRFRLLQIFGEPVHVPIARCVPGIRFPSLMNTLTAMDSPHTDVLLLTQQVEVLVVSCMLIDTRSEVEICYSLSCSKFRYVRCDWLL